MLSCTEIAVVCESVPLVPVTVRLVVPAVICEVEVRVSVVLAIPLLHEVTVPGFQLAVTCAGRVATLMPTDPLKPLTAVSVIV